MARPIKNCPHCSGHLSYSSAFDAQYCTKCDIWLEKKCSDPDCEFCRFRPETPSTKLVDHYQRVYDFYQEKYSEQLEKCKEGSYKIQDQLWVIKFNGKIISLPSGKSSWKKINHAKSALRNALAVSFYSREIPWNVRKDAERNSYLDLLNSGKIEFVNVMENNNGS